MSARPEIKSFFDEPTNSVSYLVWDAATREAEFNKLAIANNLECRLIDTDDANNILVANNDRRTAVNHGSHRQLRPCRNPDLSYQD